MCYGEISGIERSYHDYPESTIAQKVIFESSLWILSIWAYFQLEMRNYLKTISRSNYSIPGGICDQLWIIEVFSSRKNTLLEYAIFCVQNHRFLKLCLKLSQNYLKTISKLSQNYLNGLRNQLFQPWWRIRSIVDCGSVQRWEKYVLSMF